ncbi:SLC13 family permease [Ruoffia tabacinasalis]|uniref:SLC13 family permease n=1 Tax=Ruoffia tabacinasalis TaxID=87458 RepID=A0A5R9EIU6_9LACT|nr:SLC13 family permease [Ruoffia tabacinasalis]TLQ49251.1 SLC13 family permease [Ruoffia tabacinasalis]
MSNSISKGFKTSEIISIVISLLILALAVLNSTMQIGLFNIPTVTFSVLAIFASSLVLWLFVAIDWPSILCLICLGFLPEVTYGQIFQQSFGNTTFVFLFFTFLVTHALEQTSFLKRVSAWAINSAWAQVSPWRFVFAFLSVMLLISTFVSPTILFMIAFPIYEEVMTQFGLEKGDKQASKLLVALYASIAIGTAMTPINHVFAITAMGLYETAYGTAITNGQYMSFAVPAGLTIFLILLVSLKWIWRMDLSNVKLGEIASLSDLPKADKKEKAVVLIFGGVVALWLLPEVLGFILPGVAAFLKSAGIAFPPMIGALALAVVHVDGKPLVKLQEGISKGVFWPSLLIVAVTLTLGSFLSNPDMGVITLIESFLTPLLVGLSPLLMVLVFIIWAALQTNFSSNLVTVSVVTTIVITIAGSQVDLPINVAVVASLIGFMASLAYMTPPAMPYIAISIGSGWTTAKDALLYGFYLLLWSAASAVLVGYTLGSVFLSQLS